MNILRSIMTLKVIAFIALSSLFMTSLASTPAQAFHSCPCRIFLSLNYLNAIARGFNGKLDLCFETTEVNATDYTTIIGANTGCTSTLRGGVTDSVGSCLVSLDCGETDPFAHIDLQFNNLPAADGRMCQKLVDIIVRIKGIEECNDG